MNVLPSGKAGFAGPPAPATTENLPSPSTTTSTDAFEGELPRIHRLVDRLAAPTKNPWLTIGIPAAFIALGGAAAIAYFGGWITPGGAPLHDGGREDLTRSILFGDRSDGPDTSSTPKATTPTPAETPPTRTDGPN